MAGSTALILLVIASFCSVLSYRRTKDLLHPSILVTISVVLPAASTALHWSTLQADAWDWKTETLVVSGLTVLLGMLALPAPRSASRRHGAKAWHPFAFTVARCAVLLFLALFMLENQLASGYLIPALAITSETDVHTLSLSGFLWVTRNAAMFSVLAGLLWIQQRKSVDLVLLIACVSVQLTRLGRIDVLMASLAAMVTVYYRFPQGRTRQVIIRVGALCALLGVLGLTALTNYRMSRGYIYNLTYPDVIGYTGPRDPAGLLPFLYGYFSLSFENLNLLVHSWRSAFTWPLFTFQPVWGLLQFHNLFGYKFNVASMYIPVSGAATVPTGFAEFYVDAGLFAFLPIGMYGFIWSRLYLLKERSFAWTGIYAIYTAAGALLGFQGMILSSHLYFGMALLYVISCVGQNWKDPKSRTSTASHDSQ